MDREVEIDKGSNKYLEWSETLYEDDEHITYLEYGLGEVLRTMPGIDEDIEYIVKISKEDLGDKKFIWVEKAKDRKIDLILDKISNFFKLK